MSGRLKRHAGLESLECLEDLEGMEPDNLSRSTLEEVGGFEPFKFPNRIIFEHEFYSNPVVTKD